MSFRRRLYCAGRHSFLWNLHNTRQPDREGRAVTVHALDCDVAAHHLTEALADREPEPGAAVSARCGGGCLGELLEQLAHLLRRHADAGVGHRERDPVAAGLLPLPGIKRDGAFLR
jgi:hypothetical protein